MKDMRIIEADESGEEEEEQKNRASGKKDLHKMKPEENLE